MSTSGRVATRLAELRAQATRSITRQVAITASSCSSTKQTHTGHTTTQSTTVRSKYFSTLHKHISTSTRTERSQRRGTKSAASAAPPLKRLRQDETPTAVDAASDGAGVVHADSKPPTPSSKSPRKRVKKNQPAGHSEVRDLLTDPPVKDAPSKARSSDDARGLVGRRSRGARVGERSTDMSPSDTASSISQSPPPPDFDEVWRLVERLRQVRDAPVDMHGAEVLGGTCDQIFCLKSKPCR